MYSVIMDYGSEEWASTSSSISNPVFEPAGQSPARRLASGVRKLKPLKLGSCTGDLRQHSLTHALLKAEKHRHYRNAACRKAKVKCDRGGDNARSQAPTTRCGRCVKVNDDCIYEVHKTGYKHPPLHRVIVTETDRMAVSQPLDASARDSSVIPGRHNDPLADDLARHASAVPAHATFPTLAIGTGTKFSDDLFERPVVPNAASTKLFKVKPKRDCLPAEDPISKGILTEDQAVNYFNFYLLHLHPWSPVLNTRLHTFQYVRQHSTFLLCVVCLQSAAYQASDNVWRTLASHTKKVCGTIYSEGYHSLEITAAFALYASRLSYGEPHEIDQSWIHLGTALRMAVELGLDEISTLASAYPMTPHRAARQDWIERRAAEKLWLNLYILDRSMSGQMGRPTMLDVSSQVLQHVESWMASPGTEQAERLTASQALLRRVLERSHNASMSSDPHLEPTITLCQWYDKWYLQSNSSSRCNYHHVRILALMRDTSSASETEKRHEARQVVQIWLHDIASSHKVEHATTLALVAMSHAIVVLCQAVLRLDPGVVTAEGNEDRSLAGQLVDELSLSAEQCTQGTGTLRFHAAYLKLCLHWFDRKKLHHNRSQASQHVNHVLAQPPRQHALHNEDLRGPQDSIQTGQLSLIQNALFPGWTETMPSQDDYALPNDDVWTGQSLHADLDDPVLASWLAQLTEDSYSIGHIAMDVGER